MKFKLIDITKQLEMKYDIGTVECKVLNTSANYAVEVMSPNGHYALKIYNPNSRTATDVQWEIDLTQHLINKEVQVAAPVAGSDGSYLQSFVLNEIDLTVVLFDWVPGDKPKPELSTYRLIGEAAAKMHTASDSFSTILEREEYDMNELLDDQLKRMKLSLEQSGQWQRVYDLTKRMKKIVSNPKLDYGIIHNDLTLDNVHIDGDELYIFDLDSSAKSWRAAEAWGVLKAHEDRFESWLEGYRSVREFSKENENAVFAFVIIEDIRNIVWKLGFAKSSRGEPLIKTSELPKVVDEWLAWERDVISSNK